MSFSFKDVLKFYKPNSVIDLKNNLINELTNKMNEKLIEIENLKSKNNEIFTELENIKLNKIIDQENIADEFKGIVKNLLDSGKSINQIKELAPKMFKMETPKINPEDLENKKEDEKENKEKENKEKITGSLPPATL